MNSSQGQNRSKGQGGRSSNPRKGGSGGRGKFSGQKSAGSSNRRGGQEGRRSNSKRGGQGGRSRRGKNVSRRHNPLRSGDLSGLFKKYENLFEQYLQTRRKYHDFYHRTNNNQQLKKNEDNYYRSLKQLRDFEESLTEWQRLKFKEHLSIYKEELTYENAHGVDGNHDEIPQDGQFEDPHLTITQVESQDYVSDEEESVGTMEDYNRLKGIQ